MSARTVSITVALAVLIALSGSLVYARPAHAAAPTTQPPSVHLAPLGTLGAAVIPLQVSWPPATQSGSPVARYQLQVSRDHGPFNNVPLPAPLATSVTVTQRAWSVLIFRVRAIDQAAAVGAWSVSAPLWLSTAQESDAAVHLSPAWQTVTANDAFGGARGVTTKSGATAVFTFSGREVGWVARLGPGAGAVRVMLDGRDPAPINLKRAQWSSRRIVFRAIYPTVGPHTLTITTQTAGLTIDVDGFVVLTEPANATLVGAGDIASCSSTVDSATAKVAAGVPGIVFTAGDNVYPDGSPTNYPDCFGPSWGQLKSRMRPGPGNHDYLNAPGAAGYFGYFGAAAGVTGKGWYGYDAGTWRVYVLNSECSAATCPEQYSWLKASLAAEPHLCTLAIWHRPRFSTGPHGDAIDMDALWRLLATSGADLVINGHEHMYERYVPLGADGTDVANGMREFVVGTGGAGLYSFVTGGSSIAVRDNTSHGVLRLDLGQGTYSWHFLPIAGDTFTDAGAAACY